MREASAIGGPSGPPRTDPNQRACWSGGSPPSGGPTSLLFWRDDLRPPHKWKDTSVSGLWTPGGGESKPGPSSTDPEAGPQHDARQPASRPPSAGEQVSAADEAALAEELRRVRSELASTPVADIVANHAVGLWQLAV